LKVGNLLINYYRRILPDRSISLYMAEWR